MSTETQKRWKKNVKIHPVLLGRFAANLKRIMETRELSDARLGEMVGISSAYVWMLYSAQRCPSLEMVEKIATALKLDPATLLKKVES